MNERSLFFNYFFLLKTCFEKGKNPLRKVTPPQKKTDLFILIVKGLAYVFLHFLGLHVFLIIYSPSFQFFLLFSFLSFRFFLFCAATDTCRMAAVVVKTHLQKIQKATNHWEFLVGPVSSSLSRKKNINKKFI